jgi:polyferredoxin
VDTYRTKTSETPPVDFVNLRDGRKVKKLVDKSLLRNIKERKSATEIRAYVQLFFFLVTLWVGTDFYLFVSGLGKGIVLQRPPGVEGFLPISALISCRYFILTGIVNHIHPSGLFILIAVLLVSTSMKKGFCGWICPVGYISESLYQLGAKMFGRNLRLPRWADIPLRSTKYLILGFFMTAVSTMSVVELGSFIHSDYNKVADIKMYMFFAHITTFALAVIGGLLLLSLLYKNFWCRYACPYGALLGITSLISPLKIRRLEQTCIDCGKCADACPSHLPVDKLTVVNSAECIACYSCIEACPIRDTLKFSLTTGSRGLSQKQYAFVLLGIFLGIIGVAMLLGFWQNSITGAEYIHLFKDIDLVNHGF